MFASGSLQQLRYIPETVRGVTPTAGTTRDLRMTTPSLKATLAQVKSAEIRPDRLSTGATRTDMDVDGGFDFELSNQEYDPLLEGLLGSALVHYGTLGLGTVFAAEITPTTVTAAAAPTTTSALTNLAVGSWFKLVPPATVSAAAKRYFANTWFKVGARTGTTITLDASTPAAAPGLMASTAGFAVSQSTMQNSNVRKTFSIEHDLTDVGSKLLYRGLEVNSMELSLEVGAIITGSFDFIGMSHEARDGASYLPGPSTASKTGEVMNAVADVGLVMENGVNLLTGGSFIKGASLSVANNARGQKAVGVFGNAGVGLGELAISGQIEVYFQDATLYNKWLQGIRTSLVLAVADQAGNGYLFELDKVQFREATLAPGGNNEDCMLTLPFDAFFDPVTKRGIRITRAIAAAA